MKPAEATNQVGVVVLNYNCHDFLETCIQSVLDQTYKGIAGRASQEPIRRPAAHRDQVQSRIRGHEHRYEGSAAKWL